MGGSTKTTQSTNQTTTQNPWEPAIGPMNDLVGQIKGQMPNTAITDNENSALNQLTQNAQAGNPYADQIGGLANNLFSGGPDYSGRVNDAYKQYADYLTPFARGDYLDPSSNPYYKQVSDDIAGRVNGMFAGAGRDFSGAHMKTLGRGIAEGVAPLYSQERERQLGAINSLYGGANTSTGLLSGLSQTSLANQQAGIGAAQSALQARDSGANQLLSTEAMRRGLPLQNMEHIAGLLTPIAQLGGTSNTQGVTTMQQQQPLMNQILGGAIGATGLLGRFGAFGPAGWLFKGGSQ